MIWTLKNQLGLERHAARTTEGLGHACASASARSTPAIWHNWLIYDPLKRSLVAYDH